jgi:uncharacterized protein YidB (DUF937 family)
MDYRNIAMGLFDKAFEMLGSGQEQQQMLDPKTRLLQSALSLLSDNGQIGGLPGLMERFQEAGLGHLIGSWVGPGENQPISEGQVQQALGEGHLQQMSEETGMSQDEVARHLSDLLPGLVDKLTPGGEAPQGGLGNVGALLQQIVGRR